MSWNEIQGQLWTEFARRLFGGARTNQVAPDIGVQVDLFGRPEFWALSGGNLQWGVVQGLAAGGVGFRSQIAVDNPSSSNEIAIVEQIWFSQSGAAEALLLGISQTQLTTSTGNLVTRDTRRSSTAGGSAPSGIRLRTQNNAALAGVASNVATIRTQGNTKQEVLVVYPEVILSPGWSLRILANADNTAITAEITFIVRSRQARPDELII